MDTSPGTSFGRKLKELRQDRGLTQDALARASGISVGTLRDYEQGKRDPPLTAAQRLAQALGVSLDVFAPAAEETGDEPRTPLRAPPAPPPAEDLQAARRTSQARKRNRP